MQETLVAVLFLGAGLGLLVVGGELLVRGASALAVLLGIRPLVVGLTIVAFATSAPELAVSLQAVYQGTGDLAVGNLVGSNIANVLLILGVSALVSPLVISSRLVRIDVPLVIAASILLLVLGLDGVIGTWDGLLLATLLAVYIHRSLRRTRDEAPRSKPSRDVPARPRPVVPQILMAAAGLLLLGLGGSWLVQGAVAIARVLGVQELVIGLTVVAAGTSLPELVISAIAVARGARDLAVGNVVGSNLFNLLGVLGITGILAPQGVPVSPTVLALDIPVMIAAAVACLPIFFTGHRITRWEGGLFFFYYLAYMVYLVLNAGDRVAAESFGLVMTLFVIPLTSLTLLICVFRAWRERLAATG